MLPFHSSNSWMPAFSGTLARSVAYSIEYAVAVLERERRLAGTASIQPIAPMAIATVGRGADQRQRRMLDQHADAELAVEEM